MPETAEHAGVPGFRIERIEIRNYRAFERFELDLHPEVTVLVAPNGGGKTAVLDALAVAIGPFLSGIEAARAPGFSR